MIIYKTTNLINGHFYVGKDKHNNPEYIGSGILLQRAIKKYGIGNFKKEILEICESYKHMNEREKYWIKELNCCKSKNCYNISTGGDGGDNITFNPNRDQFVEKQRLRTGELNSLFGKTHTKESKQKMSHSGEENGMYGKNHTDESKLKQKEKAKGRYTLDWFIERYGPAAGTLKYEERGKWRSKVTSGENNPAYKHVDKKDIDQFIYDNPLCKLKDLVNHLNIGSTALYGKFQMYYASKNLKEVKSVLAVSS